MKAYKVLLCGLLLFSAACSSGKTLNEDEIQYFKDMNTVYQRVHVLHSYTSGSKFSKPGYAKHINESAPEAVKLLKKYSKTGFSDHESYRALAKSLENFFQGKKMWDDSKGLVLVNRRISEGSIWLEKAHLFLDQEQHPEKYVPEENAGDNENE